MARARVAMLVMFVAVGACSKKTSSSSGASVEPSASAPTLHASAKWFEAFGSKDGKGWFDVVTDAASRPGPLGGKSCALWTVFYKAKTDAIDSRISFDGWPGDAVALTVDGKTFAVPTTALVWEIPEISKTFPPTDQDTPAKVNEMLTSKEWMGHPDDALPTSVEATEHCLLPSTTYRAELRKKQEFDIEDGNQYGAPNIQNVAPTPKPSASSSAPSKEAQVLAALQGATHVAYYLALAPK